MSKIPDDVSIKTLWFDESNVRWVFVSISGKAGYARLTANAACNIASEIEDRYPEAAAKLRDAANEVDFACRFDGAIGGTEVEYSEEQEDIARGLLANQD